MANPAKVNSADSVNRLLEDALTAGRCYERLLWTFSVGDALTSSLDAGMARLEALEEANTAKQLPIAELRHKVGLIRMDERDAKRPTVVQYLLNETETDSQRCHDAPWLATRNRLASVASATGVARHAASARHGISG